MALQFLIGCIVSVINIMIHALVTVGAVGIARSAGLRHTERPRLHLMLVMVGTAAALMTAHTLEVFVWALADSRFTWQATLLPKSDRGFSRARPLLGSAAGDRSHSI